jgi:RNA polymerase sigma-70 factor (ECF subfamily)
MPDPMLAALAPDPRRDGRDAREESALVKRVAGGDQSALRELYQRYAGRVLAIAQRCLGVRGDAEEVVQETFVEIWRRAGDFDDRRGSVGAWLTTIARTRAIDRLRSRSSANRASQASAAEAPEPVPSPGDSAIQRQTQERVRGALAGLPAEQRQVLELAYFEGLSHSEIAQRTGQPLGTVKTRVRLAMEKLQKALQDLAAGSSGGGAR